jgi:small-conductance mechanosensitive channel
VTLRPRRAGAALAAVLAAALGGAAVLAAEPSEPDPRALLEGWAAAADAAQTTLAQDPDDVALRELRERVETRRSETRAFLTAQRRRVDQLRRQLEALGPAPAEGLAEEAAVADLRRSLTAQVAAEDGALSAAQVAETRFTQTLETVAEIGRDRLRTRLLTRGESPLLPSVWWTAGADLARAGADLAAEARSVATNPVRRAAAARSWPALALAAVAAAGLLALGQRRIEGWTRAAAAVPGRSRPALLAIGVAALLGRLTAPLAAIVLAGWALRESGMLGPWALSTLRGLAEGLAWIVFAHALSGAYYAPDAPALRLSSLDDRGARRARTAAMAMGAALAADAAALGLLGGGRFDDRTWVAANMLVILGGAVALWRLKRVYEKQAAHETDGDDPAPEAPLVHAGEPVEDTRSLLRQVGWAMRRAGSAVAILAPLLAAAGYYAASRELLLPAIRTVGLLGVAAMLQAFVRETVAGLGARAGVARMAPLVSGFALLVAGAPVLAVIWGADWADIGDIGRLTVEGFAVGSMTFRPLDAAFFAAVFAAGYALTRLLQRVLRVSVLPQMGVTEGSQSALVSGVGYLGVFVASLAAISATGLDLSNLAIVAGALSVGVGFGLQTIVNNFVSGIILLVERPIKVGDWIEANGVHGTVRKVNVRSTMIETFDRSTYIVPNSQLVAQPVTNFTHSNFVGRLIVAVRVSRDADVRTVERILLDVGQRHPMALRRPAPHVLFFDFGAGGTFDFELRLFLRDVNMRLVIASELRFAIVERFRDAGIPFAHPQQDVWVRAAPDPGDADALAAAGSSGPAAVAPPAAAGRL